MFEFKISPAIKIAHVLVQLLLLAFTLFQNGDGFISAKELGVLMRTLGRNPTEDEILNIMNEIDVDHNGKLDFSEFTMMMKDKLTQEDLELEIKQAFRFVHLNPITQSILCT